MGKFLMAVNLMPNKKFYLTGLHQECPALWPTSTSGHCLRVMSPSRVVRGLSGGRSSWRSSFLCMMLSRTIVISCPGKRLRRKLSKKNESALIEGSHKNRLLLLSSFLPTLLLSYTDWRPALPNLRIKILNSRVGKEKSWKENYLNALICNCVIKNLHSEDWIYYQWTMSNGNKYVNISILTKYMF